MTHEEFVYRYFIHVQNHFSGKIYSPELLDCNSTSIKIAHKPIVSSNIMQDFQFDEISGKEYQFGVGDFHPIKPYFIRKNIYIVSNKISLGSKCEENGVELDLQSSECQRIIDMEYLKYSQQYLKMLPYAIASSKNRKHEINKLSNLRIYFASKNINLLLFIKYGVFFIATANPMYLLKAKYLFVRNKKLFEQTRNFCFGKFGVNFAYNDLYVSNDLVEFAIHFYNDFISVSKKLDWQQVHKDFICQIDYNENAENMSF